MLSSNISANWGGNFPSFDTENTIVMLSVKLPFSLPLPFFWSSKCTMDAVFFVGFCKMYLKQVAVIG